MNISFLNHSLIPPILLQLPTIKATPYTLDTFFQSENADIFILPATALTIPLSDELEIIAIPQRAAMKPVLVALDEQIHFENFTRTLNIAVLSTLHQKMLAIHFQNIETTLIDYQTNIFQLLENKQIDGVFLPQFEAQERELSAYIVQKCSLEVFTPQATEGIVLIIGKRGNEQNEGIKKLFHHPPTQIVYEYEKAFATEMKEQVAALFHDKGLPMSSEIFSYATLFMDTVMINAGMLIEKEPFIIRTKAETQTGNLSTFIKNTVENILLSK